MILVHWSCQISDSSHIETLTAICKISIMMLWDHAHPYIQSSTLLCDNPIIILAHKVHVSSLWADFVLLLNFAC